MPRTSLSDLRFRSLSLAAISSFAIASAQLLAQGNEAQVAPRMATVTLPADAGQTMTVAAAPAPAVAPNITRDNGAPIGANRNSKAAGDFGPVLLEDTTLIEKLARFDRERVPERVVHARGTGAHGVFRATADISDITRASLFTAGKETPVFVRFSSVIHPSGSPEGLRDPRGFATKFYTDQGNWDLVGNNLPIFFIRDAMQFPDMVHSLKPSPVTNKQDPNRFFEFFSATPESTNMLTHLYSNLGTPSSYRTMDGNGVHAFKLVSKDGKVTFAKFRWVSRQGVKNLTAKDAGAAQFNFMTDDLYREVGKGNHPTWDLMIQTMTPEQFAGLNYNPFDDTKEWLGIPFRKIGEMTLNRMPANYFEFTEQSAFAPANLVPGIEASPDRMLQGRLFSYSDTQRYRVGSNVMQLPVNKPLAPVANNYQDGFLDQSGSTSNVNYFPAASEEKQVAPEFAQSTYEVNATVDAKPIETTNNFEQAGIFYRSLSTKDRADLIANLAGDLGQVRSDRVRTMMVSYFYQADKDYGTRLARAVNVPIAEVTKAVAEYETAYPQQRLAVR
ncbi:MAG: catalase [Sphingobium sp.]